MMWELIFSNPLHKKQGLGYKLYRSIYQWNEYVTIAVNRNLSNYEKARQKKKDFGGFNGIRTRGLCISTAVLY